MISVIRRRRRAASGFMTRPISLTEGAGLDSGSRQRAALRRSAADHDLWAVWRHFDPCTDQGRHEYALAHPGDRITLAFEMVHDLCSEPVRFRIAHDGHHVDWLVLRKLVKNRSIIGGKPPGRRATDIDCVGRNAAALI